MGLLTDPTKRDKLVKLLTKYNNILCAACYTVGIVWFLALAHVEVNSGTYFSENALLPGVVENYFYKSELIKSYYEDLREELQADKRATPKQWVYDKFSELGLEVYQQKFSVKYPLGVLPEGQLISGSNVYAILRAQRAASTEAIVVSAPFRSLSHPQRKTHAGIALMLSLASYSSKEPYWAKDIIFLVTEQDSVGMQAWLEAYHGHNTSTYIRADDLPARGGSIQAAVNIEIGSLSLLSMNIKLEGLNGQLPNLDMVNLVTKLCRLENLKPTIHKRADTKSPNSLLGYKHSLITMATMMWHQATGSPSGNHGLFHQYNIEAVTLEGIPRKAGSSNINDAGRVLEGTLRSLNNLLERFHQSFFFYLLPATNRYVSIGMYMPPFGVMGAALLIKAIALWIASAKDSKKPNDSKQQSNDTEGVANIDDEVNEKVTSSDTQEGGDNEDTTNDGDGNVSTEDTGDPEQSVITQFIPVLFVSALLGTVLYFSPEWLSSASKSFHLALDDALMYGILAIFFASLSLASILRKMSHEGTAIEWETLKSVSLVILSLVLSCIALINISLAVFLSIVNIPTALLIRPTRKRLARWFQMLLLLLASAPALLFYSSCIHNFTNPSKSSTGTPDSLLAFLIAAFGTAKRALFLSILDSRMMGNLTYPIFCFAVIPSWLMFWALSRVRLVTRN